ncbi:peptide ABC transporter substrate-binding protein [Mesorhizobium sp. LHD-90]|uniref:peptide ABC transporter substrate-binding protein n=1 Tax=Mesorhizobium sp. LHD-90 TaxID=3071414 RepID=UPI0027E0BFDE|nr:peptide ABC transporter substrate-binding protein [Mesorhizobium sp. LHD-90]MDQ6436444.1 peptide ABC transporter substrate-binding protein [Mesorhizobium sp. LHD-90]
MPRTLLLLAKVLLILGVFAGNASAEMVYRRGNTAEPETLDPGKSSTTYEANILSDLFEGLVASDARADIIPGVAESWRKSGDDTIYTFTLRRDAAWSNGDPVTADDFVYSFRRLEDPATAAEYASMLYVVKNAEAINAGRMRPETLGVRAIDARTLEITLEAPTLYFLEMLTHQATSPVHRASIERLGADWTKPGNLVSNGAFVLAERVPDDHIRIVRNPVFHDAAAVKLDAVVYYPTQDRSTAIKRFQAGELHSNDELPIEQLAELRRSFGDQIRTSPYLGIYYYHINLRKEPWSDVRLRRAISMALDREFIANKVLAGVMFPAYGMVPAGVGLYEPYRADYADMAQIDREEEAARILRDLGYGPGNPLKLELRYDTSENNANVGIAIQEQLRPLGVDVSLFNTDAKTHYGYLDGGGDFDYARGGWIADYKDPESFLGLARRANGMNSGRYDDAEFERLMDAAAGAGANPEQRMKLLAQAEKRLVEQHGLMPLLFLSTHNIVSPKVKGWQDNVMNIHPSRFISIE